MPNYKRAYNSSSLFIPLLFFEKTLIFVFTKDRSTFEQHYNITNIKSFFTDFPVLTELLKWCVTKYKTEDSFMEEWYKDMVYSDKRLKMVIKKKDQMIGYLMDSIMKLERKRMRLKYHYTGMFHMMMERSNTILMNI